MSDYKLLFERGIDVPNRTIYLNDDIDTESSFNIQLGLQMMTGDAPVLININSYGGSAIDGFCIYEMLKRENKREIVTINTGCAMSAALLIYMAGKRRLALQHCEFMYHGPKDYSDFYGADHKALEVAGKSMKEMKTAMAKLMEDATNKKQAYWSKKADVDFYFKKKEAITLGVVTEE